MSRRSRSLSGGLWGLLLVIVGACGSIFNGVRTPDHTSPDEQPSRAWESAFQFHFADSTWAPAAELRHGIHIKFFDGTGQRVITGRDLFRSDGGAVQTPWHRLWLPPSGEMPATLRVTIGDSLGGRAVAEYPVMVRRDQFYRIYLGVYTRREERHQPSPLRDLRSYEVTPAARRQPGDSLWIGQHLTGRDCFNCP